MKQEVSSEYISPRQGPRYQDQIHYLKERILLYQEATPFNKKEKYIIKKTHTSPSIAPQKANL